MTLPPPCGADIADTCIFQRDKVFIAHVLVQMRRDISHELHTSHLQISMIFTPLRRVGEPQFEVSVVIVLWSARMREL
jgi:hypothetical protein